jgi:NADPH-dependent glutamate synthase beta subunit-like oxidoreductase
MAQVVKKKKKKLGGRGTTGSTTSGKKVTPLRPYRNPQTPPCQPGCPIGNDARGALAFVGSSENCGRTYEQAFEQAFQIFARTNPMPAITGRLCTACCEKECNRQHKDASVYINKFERFVGDFAIENKLKLAKLTEEQKPEKVAVVGSGPAGLSCAYHLVRRGYRVSVFEAASRPGGLLRHVAPFRLPREVLEAEVRRILELGVELHTSTAVGVDVSMEQLLKDHKAVFVAVGAHGDRVIDARWAAANSMTGIELLDRVAGGEKVDLGKEVVVVGSGNAAIDVARACRRLGLAATVVYSRDKEDMAAFAHEVAQAEAEGVGFECLARPVELVREGDRAVKLVCQRMKLRDPDGSRRKKPVATGERFERPLTTLVMADIQEPDYGDALARVGLKGGAEPGKLKTQTAGLFVCGDANKLGHVAIAIGQGRLAAEEIIAEIEGAPEAVEKPPLIPHTRIKLDFYPDAERNVQSVISVEERLGEGGMTREATIGFVKEAAIAEAKRCFSCGMCMDCDNCWMFCQDQAVDKLAKDLPVGEHYKYKHELCTGCEKCAEECPCGFLKMV